MLDFGFYNMDCMEGMKEFPDKYFDLAIVDPPYGGSVENDKNKLGTHFHGRGRSKRYKDIYEPEIKADRTGGTLASKYKTKINAWDVAPEQEYFDELFRVSKNQIIWGGNYFGLPPTRCFVIWKKLSISENFTMGMAEYAWTSFNANSKVFEYAPQGKPNDKRFHPTQKPIALYEWLLNRYAEQGQKILDTHVGSASSLIACERLGFKYVGFEIDEVYYGLANERMEKFREESTLFNYAEKGN